MNKDYSKFRKKKKKRVFCKLNFQGFAISFEAVFSALIFSLLILSINFPENESMKELIVVQQENDLLKLWSINFPSENEMINDCKRLFNNFDVYLDEKAVFKKENANKYSISREEIILDDNLNERKIRIVVHLK